MPKGSPHSRPIPERMIPRIGIAFGIGLLAVAGIVVFSRSVVVQGPILAPQPAVEKIYPVPAGRDMLMDTVAVSPPPAIVANIPESASVPAVIPVPQAAGKILLDVGTALAGTLKLSSSHVQNGRLSIDHTCYRKNTSPPVEWTGMPSQTKSLVLFFEKDDAQPDNPAQWLVYNIAPQTTSLPTGIPVGVTLPDGALQGVGEGGRIGYTGPCIPKGQHPYMFRLFALDVVLDLPQGSHKYDIINAMNGHVIDMAVYPVTHFYKL